MPNNLCRKITDRCSSKVFACLETVAGQTQRTSPSPASLALRPPRECRTNAEIATQVTALCDLMRSLMGLS